MKKQILFIHIPKTAGTSFRKAAEEYFGKDHTLYDYSKDSAETSKVIMDTIYDSQDLYSLYKEVSKYEYSFLSGHFPVGKYASIYDTLNMVSFVRNPIEQIISHYNHYKNHHNYDKSLTDFIKEPRFRNFQSKYLADKPISLYGFLGITEDYEASIKLLNATYDTNLSYKYINIKSEGSIDKEDVDEKVIDLIKKINSVDIKFYESVKQQFYVRQKLFADNLPFTYGFIQKTTENSTSGMAFQKATDEAIEIDIYLNDMYLETVLAKNLRPGQIKNNVPRKGFIGFDYVYNGDDVLEGKLHAFVKKTGQEIV